MAKELVVYFSVYGTAKIVAEEIAKQTGADIAEILFFFLDYLAIMGLFVFIGHYLAGWLKRLDKRGGSK